MHEAIRVPRRVHVTEVGPRDGLQNEKVLLSTAHKAELVRALMAAGVREFGTAASAQRLRRRGHGKGMSMANPAPNTAGSLEGIRVIDLTRVISGPFCTQMLGDHGAEVIKIEPPERGDIVRSQGNMVEGFSWYFAQFNRNKRSLTLDLRRDEGKAILHRLLEGADVLVENFRPGVMAKMGLDDATLRERYPRLVVGRINGFGSTGPYRDRPAYDWIRGPTAGFPPPVFRSR